MCHSTRKIKADNFSSQSGLDRVSRQSNQQLIGPIKKLLLVEEDCKFIWKTLTLTITIELSLYIPFDFADHSILY